ncbi:MAG: divergent polysaccharide deacetylase family protein [Pseudomonadota bacterium]
MLRGILAGGLWGSLIGAIVLALSSQLADWRDLTPAVTRADSEDVVPSPEVADILLEPPVVTAGVRSDRPAASQTPAQATGGTTDVTAPRLETDAPGAPSAAVPPAPVAVAVPDDVPPTSPTGSTGAAPDAVDVATVGAPAQDRMPELIATETAPSPSRFGPSASDTVGELGLGSEAGDSPAVPVDGGATPSVSRDLSAVGSGGADTAPDAPAAPVAAPATASSQEPVAPTASDSGGIEVASVDSPDVAGPSSVGQAPEGAGAMPETGTPAAPVVTEAPELQSDAPVAGVGVADDATPTVETGDDAPVTADTPYAPTAAEADVPVAEGEADAPVSAEAVNDALEEAMARGQAAVSAALEEAIAEQESEGVVEEPAAEPEVAEVAEPEPLVVAEAGTRVEPRIIRRSGDEATESGAVRVRRLPTVGDEAAAEDEAAPEAAPEAEPEVVEVPGENAPAREANAIAFEVPEAAALVSIVLVHGAASDAPQPTDVPLTFAVPAWLPGAADVAADYRSAGHEVVLIPDLPPNPTAQDVEVALSVTLEEMPLAVGLIDPDGAGFQASRDATAQVVAAAARTGHGVLSASRGFNSAARLAARDGVAAATVERSIDPATEDSAAIGRVLDQAAFRARNDGVAVIVGEASAAHLAGVLAWAAENADEELAIAPVSAVLTVAEEP